MTTRGRPDTMAGEARTAPRCDRRLLHVSDPSSIARYLLPDPVEPDDLCRWVDRDVPERVLPPLPSPAVWG